MTDKPMTDGLVQEIEALLDRCSLKTPDVFTSRGDQVALVNVTAASAELAALVNDRLHAQRMSDATKKRKAG